MYLQVLEVDFYFLAVWKVDSKYLKVYEFFL